MICDDWITSSDLVDCNCPDAPESVITDAITMASEVLYALSGRQFPGLCTETVRPCFCGSCAGDWTPMLSGGRWYNICGHSSSRYCGCDGRAIRLPRTPISSVDQVLIDGAAFTAFRLDEPGWLVRTDGGSWPSHQDIYQETTEPGTWAVSYTFGQLPPRSGVVAASYLTAEIVKACTGLACRLPAHAVAVSRRGVTYDLEALKGRTGIPEADLWLATVNPRGAQRRARIVSPDDNRFVGVDSGS